MMAKAKKKKVPGGDTVLVEFDNGIAWVTFNRPEKRNAMSPTLNNEMLEVVSALELDERCQVLVLTGAGKAFSAGMDLKEYFREIDEADHVMQLHVQRVAEEWQWRKLRTFPKPTISMVKGWCFGGAFAPMVACDLAIAAEDAVFGLSEINWGIIPAGNVTRAIAETVNQRDALYYIMTGENFDGRKASEIRLVNEAVPADQLRTRVEELARVLLEKNAAALMTAREAYKFCREMNWETSANFLHAKAEQAKMRDTEGGREEGLSQFLDKKSFRPGLGAFKKED